MPDRLTMTHPDLDAEVEILAPQEAAMKAAGWKRKTKAKGKGKKSAASTTTDRGSDSDTDTDSGDAAKEN